MWWLGLNTATAVIGLGAVVAAGPLTRCTTRCDQVLGQTHLSSIHTHHCGPTKYLCTFLYLFNG